MTSEGAAQGTRFSDQQVAELMRLIKGADSVELKLTVPASAHRATIRGLPLDPVESQPRQVFFFDTPNLDLEAAGVVVRARRIQGGRADSVVKLRPVVPEDLPLEIRHSAAFNVEVDALPGGFVCSGTMKGRLTGQEVRDAVAGKIPLRKLYTKEQRAFFRAHAPAGIELDDLQVLGPTFVLKGQFVGDGGRRLVAEMWLYPDGSRIFELSTKCLPAEAFQVAAEARAYLVERGVPIGGPQQTKTRAALEFFAAELRAEAAAADAAAGAVGEPSAAEAESPAPAEPLEVAEPEEAVEPPVAAETPEPIDVSDDDEVAGEAAVEDDGHREDVEPEGDEPEGDEA